MSEMEHFGDSLQHYICRSGLKEQLEKHFFVETWYNIVGDQISRHSRPVLIRERKLLVEVKDSNWLYQLTLLKPRLIAAFNTEAGQAVIDDIKLKNVDFRGTAAASPREGPSRGAVKAVLPSWRQITASLDAEQQERIEVYVALAPGPLQGALKSFMEKSLSKQQWKIEAGAQRCTICKIPCFKKEMQQRLCDMCRRRLQAWKKPVFLKLHHKPWLKLDEMRLIYQDLEDEIFHLCRGLFLARYAERMRKISAAAYLPEHVKLKVLQRLSMRYILMLEEKDPTRIFPEDIERGLKPFPGLYQFLYSCGEGISSPKNTIY